MKQNQRTIANILTLTHSERKYTNIFLNFTILLIFSIL